MRENRAAQVANAGVTLAREWQGEQASGDGRKGLRALFELARKRYPDEEEAALFVAAFLAALPAPAAGSAPAEGALEDALEEALEDADDGDADGALDGAPEGVTLH